ncbi:MAG TPA: DUF4097 family beta strand repeat-containing protein [Gemmatimonadaceae bacterium]|jgi:hypothetical protein
MRSIPCVLVVVIAVVSCSRGHTYPSRTFTWAGDVTPGSMVNVRNLDGSVAVVPSADGKLSVDAVIVNAAPNAVEVKQAMIGNNVYFCTLFRPKADDTCGPDGHKHDVSISPFSFFNRSHTNTVRYTLHVPSNVTVDVETVNGKIAAQNIDGNVKATTVNGEIAVSTTKGTINAETVNGSIIASMASLPDSGNVHLETVNGSITSVLPEGIGGSIDLQNTNGTIMANYPNAVPDSADKHHMRIKLDEGNRRVTLETVNGSLNLTKYVKTGLVSLMN